MLFRSRGKNRLHLGRVQRLRVRDFCLHSANRWPDGRVQPRVLLLLRARANRSKSSTSCSGATSRRAGSTRTLSPVSSAQHSNPKRVVGKTRDDRAAGADRSARVANTSRSTLAESRPRSVCCLYALRRDHEKILVSLSLLPELPVPTHMAKTSSQLRA